MPELNQEQVDTGADQGQAVESPPIAGRLAGRERDTSGRLLRRSGLPDRGESEGGPPVDELEQDEPLSVDQEGADGESTEGGDGESQDQPDAWITDDVLDLAESAGLTRDDLADFENKYELQRAVRIQDRRYLSGLDKQQGQPQTPPQQVSDQQVGPMPAELPKYDPEMFDEGTLKVMEGRDRYFLGLHQAQQQYLVKTIKLLEQQQAAVELGQFNDLLDGFGHDALFGKFGQVVPGSRQDRNRDAVLKAYSFMPGRRPTKAMVERALQVDFWKELRDQDRQRFRKTAVRQSQRVLRSGRTRSVEADGDEDDRGGISPARREELLKMAAKMRTARR